MGEHTQNRWQESRRHEVCDGDVSSTFCGRAFKDMRTMVLNFCMENPTCGGKNSSVM